MPLQWDGAILSNRRALLELEEELRRVQRGQEGLEKKLEVRAGGRGGVRAGGRQMGLWGSGRGLWGQGALLPGNSQ